MPQVYESSVRVTKPSKFFVLDAQLPSATSSGRNCRWRCTCSKASRSAGCGQRQIIDQNEKLLALGQLSAGLTHQLNNPAAAAARAVSDLREKVAGMRHKLAMLADGKFSPEGLARSRHHSGGGRRAGRQVQGPRTHRAGGIRPRGRDRRLAGGPRTSTAAWDYAPTFVEAGLDTDWLERISASIDEADASASLQGAIGWLKYTIDTELMMNQIAEASSRISKLLADVKQYSQMDRAPYQSANVHDLLRSTIMMFGEKVGKDKPVKLVKEWDTSLPEIQCYPGDLNQVWTNVIDNAIQAMGGHGTLTIRTMAVGEDAIKVIIGDDGPGIPKDIVDRIFQPFFTTKPFGEGTGVGLDLAWRIVNQKHHGNIRVESEPRVTPASSSSATGGSEARRSTRRRRGIVVARSRRVDPTMTKPQSSAPEVRRCSVTTCCGGNGAPRNASSARSISRSATGSGIWARGGSPTPADGNSTGS